jgi:class 3 adenylate cyclase/tetratricopeptide (TPR) repeat protein
VAVQLPSGNVTFLFTDVEQSTTLLRDIGSQRYEAVLAAYRADVTHAIEAHGGRVVAWTGDGIFAAFGEATESLYACVDAQTRLFLRTWDTPTTTLRVRMGLHHGEGVAPLEQDYVHLAVHQAARVAAAASGGQTLVTAELAATARAAGLDVVALGRFGLRDFDEPQSMFAIGGAGAPVVTRPPRARRAEVGNLPMARTSFVGRDTEARDISKLVKENALVTVVGPGGVGKTRLAIEVAANADGDVVFVDLGGLHGHDEVAPTLARALGLSLPEGAAAIDLVASRLVDAPALVVFDCCEAVIDGAAAVVDAVLERAPGGSFLATSREPLRLDGEVVRRLAPLEVPHEGSYTADDLLDVDSVRLLVARARMMGVEVDLDREGDAVASVARRLDGVPLALELAAARLGEVTPAELDRLLDERFAALDQGRRSGPARQRSLEAVVAWSYDRLTEHEQSALARLSVFPASFPRAGAQAVGADRDLDTLIRVSLVEPEGDRFRLLDTIRAYAANVLDAEEHGVVAADLIRWCLAIVKSRDEHDASPLAEHATIVAAISDDAASLPSRLALASAASAPWARTGRGAEVIEVLLELVRVAQAEPDPTAHIDLAAVCEVIAHFAYSAGQRDLAARMLDTVVELAQRHGLDKREFNAEYLRAQLCNGHGDYEGMDAALARAEAIAVRTDDSTALGEVLAGRGRARAAYGDVSGGIELVSAAVAALRPGGPSVELAIALDLLGLLTGFGDAARGLELVKEAHAMAIAAHSTSVDAIAVNIAQMAVKSGDFELAESTLMDLLPRLREQGEVVLVAGSLLTLARVRARRSPLDARDLATEAADMFAAAGQSPGAVAAWTTVMVACESLGDFAGALTPADACVSALENGAPVSDYGEALVRRGEIRLNTGDVDGALADAVAGVDVTRRAMVDATPTAVKAAMQLLPKLVDAVGHERFVAAFAAETNDDHGSRPRG